MNLDLFRRVAFGQVIRAHREGCGLDQPVLARLAGLEPAELEAMERQGVLPGLEAAFSLADAMGTDLAELLHETRHRSAQLAAERWLLLDADSSSPPAPDFAF